MGQRDLEETLLAIGEGTPASELETGELDFKRQPDSLPDSIKVLVDAATCFANADGGTVVMGVANGTSGSNAFLGCTLDPATVQRRVHDLTDPPLMVGTRLVPWGTVQLLVMDVHRSFEIHADRQGRATRRIGTDCVPLSPQEHQRLREERLGVDWSAQPSERSTAEVSPRALETAARPSVESPTTVNAVERV